MRETPTRPRRRCHRLDSTPTETQGQTRPPTCSLTDTRGRTPRRSRKRRDRLRPRRGCRPVQRASHSTCRRSASWSHPSEPWSSRRRAARSRSCLLGRECTGRRGNTHGPAGWCMIRTSCRRGLPSSLHVGRRGRNNRVRDDEIRIPVTFGIQRKTSSIAHSPTAQSQCIPFR